MERKFSINLQGCIKNFDLPKNKPLIPLYEAVINAIQSIEMRKHDDKKFEHGIITIKLIRENRDSAGREDEDIPPIHSFEIIDNGVGFTDINMESFMEVDSTSKVASGCNGVSRFLWVKAFENVEIKSIYFDKNCYKTREFEFNAEKSEINDILTDCERQEDNCTTIRLLNCIDPYAKGIPRQWQSIAAGIIRYCLAHFISGNCPQITIIDGDDFHSLNEVFEKEFEEKADIVSLNVNNKSFELFNAGFKGTIANGNKLYICAHKRVFKVIDLSKYIAGLGSEFHIKYKFWYTGVLYGKYLDNNINVRRFLFSNFEEDKEDKEDKEDLTCTIGAITIDQIIKSVSYRIKKFLKGYFRQISVIEELTQKYWNYYLMLEKRFIDSLEYVELNRDNFQTFSNGYALLLQATGGELDAFFKEFCGIKTKGTIKKYAEYILEKTPDIVDMALGLQGYDIKLQPFENWDAKRAGQSLPWWQAFTDIKHNRYKNLKSANQKNVLNMLGALYLLENMYLQNIIKKVGFILDTKTGKDVEGFEESSKLFILGCWTSIYMTEAVDKKTGKKELTVLQEVLDSDNKD